MNTKYSDDELLALSGIQHFAFCPRQWALIHIEKQWEENLLTTQGKHLHERVDNPDFFEARGSVLTTRSVPLSSYDLGFYGVADMVEFHSTEEEGVPLKGRTGLWRPVPIEYKRGKPKRDNIDEVQLCAQAICLEEMLGVSINYGYFFYGEIRHRIKIIFTPMLRDQTHKFANDMHQIYEQRITPVPTKNGKVCKACSLINICLPKLNNRLSVDKYIKKYLG